MKRREFLSAVGTTAAGLALAGTQTAAWAQETASPKHPFVQEPLPYKSDALAPLFSELQVETHYGKHHAAYAAYIDALTQLTPAMEITVMLRGSKDLEALVINAREKTRELGDPLFNNAAQLWNHNFFWQCLSPTGGGKPEGELMRAIERDFGGFDQFSEQFRTASTRQFASGWGWLVKDARDGKLSILTTSNAETPLGTGKIPLLTADVWEHTYYVDYLNRRADYLAAFMDKINWEFVATQFVKTA